MQTTRARGKAVSDERSDLHEIAATVASHDAQLAAMANDVGAVKGKMEQVFGILSELRNSLTLAQAKSPFDVAEILSVVRDGIVICGAVVSLIVWVTSGLFSEKWARQDERNLRQTEINRELTDVLREFNKSRATP